MLVNNGLILRKKKKKAMVVGFRFWESSNSKHSAYNESKRSSHNVIFGVVDMAKQCKSIVFGGGDKVNTYICPFPMSYCA